MSASLAVAPDLRSSPLAGVRVLDLTRLLPGPYCTLVLAQLGADVVKLEQPRIGDYARFAPPMRGGTSITFAALNRGKASVALDLKREADREAFLALVEQADVVVESFRPQVMERLGCGWHVARQRRPGLVWCAITGYGQVGTRAQRAGHDINYLALSGLLGLLGAPGTAPAVPGFQAADIAGGALWACLRILAALLEARTTGRGQFLDVSMTAGVSALAALAQATALSGEPAPRGGTGVLGGEFACYSVYATADGGAMALGALEPKFWAAFCEAVGRLDWVPSHLVPARQPALKAEVAALFAQKSRAAWEEHFAQLDVCCEPVLSVDEALERADACGEPWATRARARSRVDGVGALPDLAGGADGPAGLAPSLGSASATHPWRGASPA